MKTGSREKMKIALCTLIILAIVLAASLCALGVLYGQQLGELAKLKQESIGLTQELRQENAEPLDLEYDAESKEAVSTLDMQALSEKFREKWQAQADQYYKQVYNAADDGGKPFWKRSRPPG